MVREHRVERAPDPALDVRRELGRSLGDYGQDGLVRGTGPVVIRDRVEVAAVSAQGERGACYQALGHSVAALAEQVMSLAEDDVQLADVVVSDFQPDHPRRPADGPRRRVNRAPRHERPGTQFPAIRCQQDVEGGHQPCGLLRVGLDQRVGHEGQEVEQYVVRPVGELKPRVAENPVVVPVEVGDAVPHDVLPGRGVPGVSRPERVQVVKLAEELGLVQPTPPRTFLRPQEVEDVPPGDRGDVAGLAGCLGRGSTGERSHVYRMAPCADTRAAKQATCLCPMVDVTTRRRSHCATARSRYGRCRMAMRTARSLCRRSACPR